MLQGVEYEELTALREQTVELAAELAAARQQQQQQQQHGPRAVSDAGARQVTLQPSPQDGASH